MRWLWTVGYNCKVCYIQFSENQEVISAWTTRMASWLQSVLPRWVIKSSVDEVLTSSGFPPGSSMSWLYYYNSHHHLQPQVSCAGYVAHTWVFVKTWQHLLSSCFMPRYKLVCWMRILGRHWWCLSREHIHCYGVHKRKLFLDNACSTWNTPPRHHRESDDNSHWENSPHL